jgi:DNA polymerase-3 subunit epsilon
VSIDFVALDFETANYKRASVIQIGITKIRDGQHVKTHTMYVTPPPAHSHFEPRLIDIHKIRPHMVVGAPEWPDILRRVLKFSGNFPIVAHNAAFERTVIEQASQAYGLDVPAFQYFCSAKLAKIVWPAEPTHSLGTLSASIGLPAFDHHDAGADARASAELVLEAARILGIDSLDGMPPKWVLPPRK